MFQNLGEVAYIKIRVWIPPQVVYDVVKDLVQRIKKAISEAGIETPSAQVDIWFRTPLIIYHQCTAKTRLSLKKNSNK